MLSSAAEAHLLQGSTCCGFRDGILHTVMNLVATHYISCTTLQLHITYGLHLPSFTALTHSHPRLHQSHSCHQSLICPDCLTTPAPHSHTHTFKQHTSMQTLQSLVLAPADISERYSSCYLLSLCLPPDCPTLELSFVSAGPAQLSFISAGPAQLSFVSAGPAQLAFSAGSVQFSTFRAPPRPSTSRMPLDVRASRVPP